MANDFDLSYSTVPIDIKNTTEIHNIITNVSFEPHTRKCYDLWSLSDKELSPPHLDCES